MKQWWIDLSLRDKQTLIIGAMAVILFLFYSVIWAPLDNKVTTLRTQLAQNKQLAAWMQAADKELTRTAHAKHSDTLSGSLLSYTQKHINQSKLAKQLTQLKQADANAVQLSFKEVDFDTLIAWVTESSQAGIKIAQLTIAPSENPGIVSAELQLRSS